MTRTPMPATPDPRGQLVSLAVAAEYASVTPKSIRNWIAEGKIPGYRASQRAIRVRLADVDALFAPMQTGGIA